MEEARQAKLAANKNTNMFRTVDPNAILAKDAEVEAKRQALLANMNKPKGKTDFGARGGGRRGRKSRNLENLENLRNLEKVEDKM